MTSHAMSITPPLSDPHSRARKSIGFGILAQFVVIAKDWKLITRLTRREVEARYRGSLFGILWTVLNPLLLLAVYTFVFSEIFASRWDLPVGSKSNFALVMFIGLILFNIFAEVITRSPALMLNNSVYIKKVVFPIEILPVVVLASALFNAFVSFFVLLFFYVLILGLPPVTALLVPLTLIPLLFFSLGLSWFLSSLGVYVRDVQQIVGVFITVTMFLSPLFYPLSALPVWIRPYVGFSPIAMAVEDARALLFQGVIPSPAVWVGCLAVSLLVSALGFVWFSITKKGFADVL